MFTLALIYAACTGGIFTLLDAIRSYEDEGILPSLLAGAATFIVTLFSGWFTFWYFTDPQIFGNVYWNIFWCALVGLIVFGIKNAAVSLDSDRHYFDTGAVAAGLFLVFWLFFGAWHTFFKTDDNAMAQQLASKAKVTIEKVNTYPDSDPEHMVLMPTEAAKFKAEQALNQSAGNGQNLSTTYVIGSGILQVRDNHTYWEFDLRFDSWRNANSANRIVPGYIEVDAENPNAEPSLKVGFTMKYTPGAPTDNSLNRLVWTKYPNYVVDDPTLEVNDDGQPYYTASLDRPATTFEKALPVKFIIIDPQTGVITEYPLDKVPSWVDRVYSKDAVKTMVNWWGHWSQAPFGRFSESSRNRFKVSGDPIMVYVKDPATGQGHPEWQMMLTSWKSDTSATYIALFDAQANKLRIFEVPGLQTEAAVEGVFKSAPDNVTKKYLPKHLSLHKIYGQLTWVVSFIPGDEDPSAPKSLTALGLLDATHVQANNVVIAETKEQVLANYQRQLAGDSASANDPSADNKRATVTGIIAKVSTTVQDGKTTYLIILEEDSKHVYSGEYDKTKVELPFAAVGSKVTITYADVADTVRQMVDYDDSSLSLR